MKGRLILAQTTRSKTISCKGKDVVSATRRGSGVAPRACVRVYARVLMPTNLYIHTYITCLFLRNEDD